MRFLAKANWRFHKGQYIASGIAVIVCCCFIFASIVASNVITWATETTPESAKTRGVTVGLNYMPEVVQGTVNEMKKDNKQIPDIIDLREENGKLTSIAGSKKLVSYVKEHPEYGKVTTNREEEWLDDPAFTFRKLVVDRLETFRSELGKDTTIAWDITGNVTVAYGDKQVSVDLQAYDPNVAKSARSRPIEGRFPSASNEIVLRKSYLERLNAKVGDQVHLVSNGEAKSSSEPLTIVGELPDDLRSQLGTESVNLIYVDPKDGTNKIFGNELRYVLKIIPGKSLTEKEPDYYRGYDQDTLWEAAHKVAKILNDKGLIYDQIEVSVTDRALANGQEVKIASLVFFSAFQIMAVIFCMAVVANTYQVVLARRRRENALLRCLGANVRQLRRAQLWECFFLGLIASTIGVIIGFVGTVALLCGSGQVGTIRDVLAICGLDPVIVSWIIGVITPVLAGIRPTWRAAKISPIAALNPQVLNQLNAKKRHIFRTVFGVLCILVGIGFCIQIPHYIKLEIGSEFAILFAIAACFCFAMGLILLSLSLLPVVSSWLLKPFSKKSALVDLARLHIRREPHRTGATATALMMGIILVSTLMIGSNSVERSAYRIIDRNYPVDALLALPTMDEEQSTKLENKLKTLSVVEELQRTYGVSITKIVTSRGKSISISDPIYSLLEQQKGKSDEVADQFVDGANEPEQSNGAKQDGRSAAVRVARAFTADHKKLINDPEANYLVKPGTIQVRVHDRTFKNEDFKGPWQVTFAGKYTLTLQPELVSNPNLKNCLPYNSMYLISDQDLQKVSTQGGIPVSVAGFVAKMDHEANLLDLISDMTEMSGTATSGLSIEINGSVFGGGIAMIVVVRTMINVILILLLMLIAVCVVISLLGVANTLTLSAVDRAKENALLRTMGFSQKQVQRLVVLEALVIGLGALIVGLLASSLFAWIGVESLPIPQDRDLLALYLPWARIAIVVTVTLACCYLASVLPGRRASRESPIEAMASTT